MKVKWLDVQGFSPAVRAMRAPLSSWEKSDSEIKDGKFIIGEKDKELSIKLQNAG